MTLCVGTRSARPNKAGSQLDGMVVHIQNAHITVTDNKRLFTARWGLKCKAIIDFALIVYLPLTPFDNFQTFPKPGFELTNCRVRWDLRGFPAGTQTLSQSMSLPKRQHELLGRPKTA